MMERWQFLVFWIAHRNRMRSATILPVKTLPVDFPNLTLRRFGDPFFLSQFGIFRCFIRDRVILKSFHASETPVSWQRIGSILHWFRDLSVFPSSLSSASKICLEMWCRVEGFLSAHCIFAFYSPFVSLWLFPLLHCAAVLSVDWSSILLGAYCSAEHAREGPEQDRM